MPDYPAACQIPTLSEPLTVEAHARLLNRLADAELQHGHIGAAEFLARRAADLREVAR